ncbi:MAG: hypothetical protein A2Y07_03725 [Planctomycetes bacterium GWF2_50_10]|nr:MAG: hypothetical protein A2Y07_03725 [Planctomycetes bacterium GWF2_50_10]
MKTICFLTVCLSLITPLYAQDHWSAPQPLTDIAGDFNTAAPFLSYDGKSLYFRSDQNRQNVSSRFYVATRPQPDGSFSTVTELTQLNDANSYSITQPNGSIIYKTPSFPIGYIWVSPDNLLLYYTELAKSSIYCVSRVDQDQPWKRTGQRIYPNPNFYYLSTFGRFSFTGDELLMAIASNSARYPKPLIKELIPKSPLYTDEIAFTARITVADIFGPVSNAPTLNSRSIDTDPFLISDGLTIYFASDRDANNFNIFKASRPTRTDQFSYPERITDLEIPGFDLRCPCLSSDGKTIYFEAQQTSGTATKCDIYYSRLLEEPVSLASHLMAHAAIEKDKASAALANAQDYEHQAMINLNTALNTPAYRPSFKSLLKTRILLSLSILRDKTADETLQKAITDLEKAFNCIP